nr:hypothetical protein CFP56_48836 [Quercus suber]
MIRIGVFPPRIPINLGTGRSRSDVHLRSASSAPVRARVPSGWIHGRSRLPDDSAWRDGPRLGFRLVRGMSPSFSVGFSMVGQQLRASMQWYVGRWQKTCLPFLTFLQLRIFPSLHHHHQPSYSSSSADPCLDLF